MTQLDRLLTVDFEQAGALQQHAKERPAVLGAAHDPLACAAGGIPEAYAAFAENAFAGMGAADGTKPADVAEAVWRAVNDPASPMRIPAGADAIAMAEAS